MMKRVVRNHSWSDFFHFLDRSENKKRKIQNQMIKSKGIQGYSFSATFYNVFLLFSNFINFSIITIREQHFDSAFELFVETKTGFPLTNELVVPSVS